VDLGEFRQFHSAGERPPEVVANLDLGEGINDLQEAMQLH
jgi:hypothetical protein